MNANPKLELERECSMFDLDGSGQSADLASSNFLRDFAVLEIYVVAP